MSSYQIESEPNQNIKIKAKNCAITWTVIYSILFIPASYMALLSSMVFDSSSTSLVEGFLLIFSAALIPLSLPLSIDLMWSSYLSEEYNKALFFRLLPGRAFFIFFGLNIIISVIKRMVYV